MKLKLTLILSLMGILGMLYAQPSAQESNFIKVDQFGYLPNASKVAVISDPQSGFNAGQSFTPGGTYQVREWASGNVVFTGSPQTWNGGTTHSQSGDRGWWFDFSSVTATGTYYLYDTSNGVRSYEFEIRDDVYNNALKAATRMFYYNRSGIAKVAPYAESNWRYNGAAFQQQDNNSRYYQTPNDASSAKDLSGGWFDAGDFNKYITFANRPVHDMLWAYQENPAVFGDNWNIPESGNNIPDVLDELKWELDWMFKMNNSDGSTHIKMGSISYNDNAQVPPDANTDPRYYGPTCSSASIAVAGMFAHAAKVFQGVPGMNGFAQELRNRAETSWNYVLPALNNNQLSATCDDQVIKSGDADWQINTQRERALAAAIYLFELTGNNTYNQYISNNIGDAVQQINNNYWDHYNMPLNDALLLYTTLPNANNNTVNLITNSIQTNVNGNWNGFYGFDANADLYRVQMPGYGWGSNREISAIGALNQLLIKYGINTGNHSDYELRTNQMAHYIHGVNPLGMTYLTNMYSYGGDNCANEMYHDWFKDGSQWDNALNSNGPAPGYIVGGANKDFSLGNISPPANQPEQKSYLDYNTGFPDNSWEISEPSITYQGAYVRLIASLATAGSTSCPPAGTPCDDGNANTINDVEDGNCGCSGTPVQGNCELITNGGFDSDVSGWNSWACNPSASNGVANITGISSGANPWDAGFTQQGVALQQGKTYAITFSARADNNRTMTMKSGLSVSPWTAYVYETINLTTSMQPYTYTFTMSGATNTNASFEFLIGNNSSNVYIDNVSVKEDDCGENNCPTAGTACNDNNSATYNDVEDGNCNCAGTACPSAGTSCDDNNPNTTNDVEDGNCNCAGTPIQSDCELITNGNFDSDVSNWNSWGCNPYASNGVANITTINAGANPWDAGFTQQGVSLEQGKTYTLSFQARASNNRTINVKSGLSVSPWTSYFYETVNLSTSMQTYSFTFTAPTTNNSATCEFFIGINSSNVYIDNVSFKENDCGGNNCPAAGTACNDNNSATYNDVEDGNCNCAGTACPSAGTSCDDGNAATYNDVEDGFCNCTGTACPSAGTSCDDGNPNTTNDVEDGNCNCAGTPISTNCELIANGTFDADLNPWESWGCNPSASSGWAYIGGLWQSGGNAWDAGFSHRNLFLEQGKTYTISFDAFGDNRDVDVKVGLGTAPYTLYHYETVSVNWTGQNFTMTFTMTAPTTNAGALEFFLGGFSGDVGLDNVSLQAVDCNSKQDLGAAQAIQLYPNPANDNIQLMSELSESAQADILLYDAFGKLVKHIPNVELLVGSPTEVEVSQLPAGIYFCTLQSDKWQTVKKFVIAR